MRRISTLTMVVVVAGGACQPLPNTPPSATQPASAQPPATQPSCNSYTVPVTVGGQPQQAVVEACQQADGSWRITQTTPGLPPQVYEVPAPAYSPYPSAYSNPEAYPYSDFSPHWGWEGWGWAGAPWFLGLAPSIVVVQRFHHFHYGFAHGGHGFAHGAGHGFAGMRGGGMAGGRR
jgi:surface antigen